MAFTIDPTTPADAQDPRQGAADIRAITLELLQLLSQGGGSAVTFSAAPFSVDTAGHVTIPTTIVVPTPTTSMQAATKGYVDAKTASNVSFFGIASGTNSYAVTLTPAPASLASLEGIPIIVAFSNANTNVSTINVNGFGTKPLSGGYLTPFKWYTLVWDGAKFQNLERVSIVSKVAAQAVTGTSLANDTVLFFPMAINETWFFQLNGKVSTTNASDGMLINFTSPTGATGTLGGSGTLAVVVPLGTNLNPTSFGSSPAYLNVSGTVMTDGTHTGLLRLQFAADTGGVTVTMSPSNTLCTLMAIRISQ